ncbi:MAG: endonuclease MutS2 [Synergistetes bacterium]|nr:endonuclease MutS2 [Synergistota bacterium]
MNTHVLRVLEWDKIKGILFRYVHTPMGKKEVGNIRPLGDRHDVEYEYGLVKEAISVLDTKSLPSWNGIVPVSPYLERVKTGWYMDGEDILRVKEFLVAPERFKSFFAELIEFPMLRSVVSGLRTFPNIVRLVEKTISSDGMVMSSASVELARVRKEIKSVELKLDRKLRSMVTSSRYMPYLQEAVYTIRNGRYVLPVKREFKNIFPGVIHDQSSSGMTVFMEPLEIVALDNELKDLKALEEKEIERILRDISFRILAKESDISANEAIFSKLDFIFAKAEFALEKGAIIPEIVEKRRFYLRNVRHPLLGESAVPITVYLGKGFKHLIITGPNTGGKTVSLKTVGVNILMALSGIPILADDGSYIYPFREIWADIGDEQSIEQNLSTFSSHMNNIVDILRNANTSDLVLLDELGSGTDPVEGSALALSILEELYKRDILALIATHYPALKHYAFETEGVENASVEFDPETLRPTYRIAIGIPGGSNAFFIAKRLGLPDRVIQRAKDFMGDYNVSFNDIIYEINRVKEELSKEKQRLSEDAAEVERLKVKYREKLRYLREYEVDIKRDISKKARRLLDDFSKEIDRYWKKVSDGASKKYYAVGKDIVKALSNEAERFGHSEREAFEGKSLNVDEIVPGKRVALRSIGVQGIVERVDRDKGKVWIVAGNVRGKFDIKDLMAIEEEPRVQSDNQKSVSVEVSKPVNVPSSIMIRNMMRDEASDAVKSFLDKAYRAGYPSVTIIHGKGEGILRREVHNILSETPYVRSYRLGNLAEGGDGVTIVYFER